MTKNAQAGVGYNFANLDEQTKRMIRRALLKAVAIPGYQVPFASRIITRPAEPSEDHEPATELEFARRTAAGDFCMTWAAHGLNYAIPAQAIRDIACGMGVVCSVSRSIVAEARERFPGVLVIEIWAPADVRELRLAARGREGAEERRSRLDRAPAPAPSAAPDVLIDNGGPLDKGGRAPALDPQCDPGIAGGGEVTRRRVRIG